ncbi:MAG: hypothetical protein GY810_17365 [Aureispira sp.]|nr:hypothetical protein [Aureispira sp.]
MDTIYFKAKKNGAYEFMYNHCCGGFNIQDLKTRRYTTPKFIIQLKKTKANSNYLITLEESGILTIPKIP